MKKLVKVIMMMAAVMLMATVACAKNVPAVEPVTERAESPCVFDTVDVGSGVTANFKCDPPIDIVGPCDITEVGVGFPVTAEFKCDPPIDIIGPCDITKVDVSIPGVPEVTIDCRQ